MNVSAVRERTRMSTPTRQSGVTARLNENEVSIGGMSLQNGTLQPGFFQDVTYTVVFQNINWDDTQFDPDVCDAGLFQVGFQVQQSLYVNGELVNERTDCLTSDRTFKANFRAPDDVGQAQVRLVLHGGKSGNKVAEATRVFNVDEDGGGGGGIGDACSTNQDCPSGTTCQNGECVSDGSGGGGGGGGGCGLDPACYIESAQTTAWVIAVVLVIALIASVVL